MAFAVFNKKLIGRGQSTEACDEVVDVSRPNLLGNPFPIGVGPNSSREQAVVPEIFTPSAGCECIMPGLRQR
jgi:hypothetical protein